MFSWPTPNKGGPPPGTGYEGPRVGRPHGQNGIFFWASPAPDHLNLLDTRKGLVKIKLKHNSMRYKALFFLVKILYRVQYSTGA